MFDRKQLKNKNTRHVWRPCLLVLGAFTIANLLHEAGFYISAVSPLLIKEYGGNSLRKVKTDKADAVKIARYAFDNWSELRNYTPMDTIRYHLKTLNRQFHLASKQKTAVSNNLIALLEQTFSCIRKCFDSPVHKDGTEKWVDFVHTFWHADCVQKPAQTPSQNATTNGTSGMVTSLRTVQSIKCTRWKAL